MNNKEIIYDNFKSYNNESININIDTNKKQINKFYSRKKNTRNNCKKRVKNIHFKDSINTKYFAQSKIYNSPKPSELPMPIFD
jgi:transposase